MNKLEKGSLLSVEQVAEILQFRTETVLRKIYSKEIKASKLGRNWRIKSDDLLEYFESNLNRVDEAPKKEEAPGPDKTQETFTFSGGETAKQSTIFGEEITMVGF